MELANKKILTKVQPQVSKCTTIIPKSEPPIISITYLEKSKYDLEHLFKCNQGDKKYVKIFQDFLDKVKQYKSISELFRKHGSHINFKNLDSKSNEKAKKLRENYNLDVHELIHLHCCAGGTGEFVLHGFTISNRFEIVWIDPKHEIHQ